MKFDNDGIPQFISFWPKLGKFMVQHISIRYFFIGFDYKEQWLRSH